MIPGRRSAIYVAGHTGMVGAALVRRLRAGGYERILLRTHAELELTDQAAVREYLLRERPDYVFVAAAKVGGIAANSRLRAEFIHQNLMIAANLVHAAWQAEVDGLMFLGSSCVYPRDCAQPIREEYLLTGPLEPTNEPYAIAKIAGIKLCESFNRQYGTRFLSVMPTNLYGPGDNYDLQTSHVLPALLRKAHEARLRGERELVVWGSGAPRREFLHVDDLADACIFLMERGIGEGLYNIGSGAEVTIRELAGIVMRIAGFEGTLAFDASRPDGTPRKLLDSSRLRALGWKPAIALEDGIRAVYQEHWGNA
jgi:GDP-L-fucose synthase